MIYSSSSPYQPLYAQISATASGSTDVLADPSDEHSLKQFDEFFQIIAMRMKAMARLKKYSDLETELYKFRHLKDIVGTPFWFSKCSTFLLTFR